MYQLEDVMTLVLFIIIGNRYCIKHYYPAYYKRYFIFLMIKRASFLKKEEVETFTEY